MFLKKLDFSFPSGSWHGMWNVSVLSGPMRYTPYRFFMSSIKSYPFLPRKNNVSFCSRSPMGHTLKGCPVLKQTPRKSSRVVFFCTHTHTHTCFFLLFIRTCAKRSALVKQFFWYFIKQIQPEKCIFFYVLDFSASAKVFFLPLTFSLTFVTVHVYMAVLHFYFVKKMSQGLHPTKMTEEHACNIVNILKLVPRPTKLHFFLTISLCSNYVHEHMCACPSRLHFFFYFFKAYFTIMVQCWKIGRRHVTGLSLKYFYYYIFTR